MSITLPLICQQKKIGGNVMSKAFSFPIPSAPDGVVWLQTNGEISKVKREWLPDGVCEPDPSPIVPAPH